MNDVDKFLNVRDFLLKHQHSFSALHSFSFLGPAHIPDANRKMNWGLARAGGLFFPAPIAGARPVASESPSALEIMAAKDQR